MKYIIIGLGNYGGVLAEELSLLGNEVIGVDTDEHRVEMLKDKIAASFILDATEEQAMSLLPLKDVDIVITTRELAQMIKEAGINFNELEDQDFDNPLGESSGASVIFGTTGGVIEAALRTAYEWLTKETLENVEFEALRGLDGTKEATVNINGQDIKIAVTHGLGNARALLEKIRAGEAEYHAIEIMACPGGCIGGGGQPYHHGDLSILSRRIEGIYSEDRSKTIRKSHENPMIKQLYAEYLGEPYGHKAHELLHTTYTARQKM